MPPPEGEATHIPYAFVLLLITYKLSEVFNPLIEYKKLESVLHFTLYPVLLLASVSIVFVGCVLLYDAVNNSSVGPPIAYSA